MDRYFKKISIVLCAFLLLAGCQVQAKKLDYSSITNSAKIVSALKQLENTEFKDTLDAIGGNNLTQKPVVIKFMKLSYISVDYRNCNAVVVFDNQGRMYILIDSKLKKAPAEAIAALLTHEIIHQDNITSIEEETRGWTNEAICWMAMKKKNPKLAYVDSPLVSKLNKLEKMYKDANNTDSLIKQAVEQNTVYSKLAMNSPGY